MKLIENKVVDFINKVDEKSPTPGGGSVSALASTSGAALLRMVGHLTISKKKFKTVPEEIQHQFIKDQEALLLLKEKLLACIDKDTDAYNLVMAAYKLPKDTEEEIIKRNDEIEKATIVAIDVPLEVAVLSYETMTYIDYIIKHGNTFTISDMGVACLMLYAGLEGALLNVKINLPGLSNESQQEAYQEKLRSLQEKAIILKDTILQKVNKAL